MEIACQLNSTVITPADFAYQARAVDVQMEQHWAPAYLDEPWPTVGYATLRGLGAGTFWPLMIVDSLPLNPNALGDHSFVAGLAFGRVLANKDPLDASVLSHEALELRGDPQCDLWMPMGDGRFAARELCDPCENDTYAISVAIGSETRDIKVSDFVLPAWFVSGAPGPYSYLDRIDEPFGLSRNGGGYRMIRDSAGNVSSDFGRNCTRDHMAEKLANPLSRTYRRGLR
jgi:hypothetical protein